VLFGESIKTHHHPTGKRVRSLSMGKTSRARRTSPSLSPHRSAPSISYGAEEEDSSDHSAESSDDGIEWDESSDWGELIASASGLPIPGLTPGLDLSGLDNENGCCHLNSVIVMLFSCRMFRRFFGADDYSPPAPSGRAPVPDGNPSHSVDLGPSICACTDSGV
jgi:hypothetical protein